MATYKPLSTDFKDDILASQNSKRKYTQVNNSDGTVSFQDSTAYSQVGSSYGAKEVIEEREAINNIYANKLVTLDEIDLVTEPGFFVDAQVVKELNSKIITTDSGTCIKHANGFMEQFIKAKVLTKTFSAWGSCYYASTPAVDYIEPFVTVFDADVRIEADGQAWTMGVDNGTLKQSPRVYAMRPNSPGGQLLVTVRVHATGTWK